jgi:hypothetical protein
MNDTNRALNRTVVFVVGLVLMALGATTVLAVTWQPFADMWTNTGRGLEEWLAQANEMTSLGATTVTGLALGTLAVIVLLIALVIVVIVRAVSGGRARAVLRSNGAENPLGRVTVTESFASDALKASLADRDEILSTQVTANDIRRRPVMHVSVTPRQNTDPRLLAEHVDTLVGSLAKLTGQDVPTYISIHTGQRARIARDKQRLS